MTLDTDRRKFLGGTAATTMLGCAFPGFAAPRAPFFERHGLPIGLQFGILGDRALRDVEAAFAQIAAIGFREVEMSGLYGRKPEDVAAAARNAGVKIVSLHLPLQLMGGASMLSMGTDPQRIADVMGLIGAKWAIAPILIIPPTFRPKPGERMENAVGRAVAEAGADIWKQSAELLNTRAALLQPLGVGVAYHNHNLEFAPVDKTTGWDILRRATDPGLVHFEIDVGWVDLAGIDPVALLKTISGRVRLIHVRDMLADKPRSFDISMNSPVVGSGRLDWARILPAAHRSGARHFIVEQDPAGPTSLGEAVRQSFQFLTKLAA